MKIIRKLILIMIVFFSVVDNSIVYGADPPPSNTPNNKTESADSFNEKLSKDIKDMEEGMLIFQKCKKSIKSFRNFVEDVKNVLEKYPLRRSPSIIESYNAAINNYNSALNRGDLIVLKLAILYARRLKIQSKECRWTLANQKLSLRLKNVLVLGNAAGRSASRILKELEPLIPKAQRPGFSGFSKKESKEIRGKANEIFGLA